MPGPIGAASITPVPADIRAEGADAVKRYRTALDFEQLLVRQLAAQLTSTANIGGAEEEESAATSLQRELIPEALADSITMSGGLGLARALYRSLETDEGRGRA